MPAVVTMLLNADLGENEPAARTRALLRLVDLANIACGGHAGTAVTMERCVALALSQGVAIGAHPGLADAFGRGSDEVDPAAFELLLLHQVSALAQVARRHGAALHHVKLHGALYHATERVPVLARCYVAAMVRYFPGVRIVALAGGTTEREARRAGVPVLGEVFADRGYRANGSLIPRGSEGALIEDPREAARRIPLLKGATVCVHADSPLAVRIARAVRAQLGPRRR